MILINEEKLQERGLTHICHTLDTLKNYCERMKSSINTAQCNFEKAKKLAPNLKFKYQVRNLKPMKQTQKKKRNPPLRPQSFKYFSSAKASEEC